MTEWRIFKTPTLERFKGDKKRREKYLEGVRCGVCHKKLQDGDEWDFRAITNNPGFTQQAVIVHRKCVNEE